MVFRVTSEGVPSPVKQINQLDREVDHVLRDPQSLGLCCPSTLTGLRSAIAAQHGIPNWATRSRESPSFVGVREGRGEAHGTVALTCRHLTTK